jgi:hypothetical protein
MRRRLMLCKAGGGALLLALAGCAVHRDSGGRTETRIDPKYLFKTDIDRVMDAGREQVMESLFLIADKLYRRNPREWKKSGAADRDTALTRLIAFRDAPPASLEGKVEGAAAMMAFDPEYSGDRVAALIYGLVTMVDAACEHRNEFFILDNLNEQKFHNAARNMEIALWKLSSTKSPSGEPLLLANEINPEVQNLSFEREFGRIIGLLDLAARLIADKNGRLVSRAAQSLATSLFLPVGALK